MQIIQEIESEIKYHSRELPKLLGIGQTKMYKVLHEIYTNRLKRWYNNSDIELIKTYLMSKKKKKRNENKIEEDCIFEKAKDKEVYVVVYKNNKIYSVGTLSSTGFDEDCINFNRKFNMELKQITESEAKELWRRSYLWNKIYKDIDDQIDDQRIRDNQIDEY